MNRAEKRRQHKLAEKAARRIKPAQVQSPGIPQSLDLGLQHHAAGRLNEAESLYHEILQVDPRHPIALQLLGVIAHQRGNNDSAVDLINKAIAIKPDYADAYFNLGVALKELGKPDEAIASYHKALAINADYAAAHNNLGIALGERGHFAEAVASYRKAIAIKPAYAAAHNNLGNTLKELNNLADAEASYRMALATEPAYAEAHNNLGNTLKEQGKLDEAVACFETALAIKPAYADAHNNLGNAFKELGRLDDAVANCDKALAINPDYAVAHSNALLIEQYRCGHNARSLYQLHCRWDERHGRALRTSWPVHQNTVDAQRRLRIGFVSPDLGRHPVGYFVVGLLENLPKDDIETVVYCDCPPDDLTARIKAASDVWHDIRGTSDEKLATMIGADVIDILIDLSGHSANNRLLVFARKPAPLQVTWAGYVGTTGLSAIDYLISDRYSTPPDEEQFYQEKVIRMADGWLCYSPPDYAPAVAAAPFRMNGYVTFGSLSNPAKINAEVVAVWAKILGGAANSRLLLKYKGIDFKTNRERLTRLFEAHAIDRSRITFEGRTPHAEALARYNDIDIALDPFPYSGGLTTYEALWMGVPVITLAGETFASRHSLSHLSTVGLPELVAFAPDDYVRLALELADDGDRLAGLRADLRDKMANSPLCDGEKFAQGFAALMRDIWRDWCSPKSGGSRP